MLRDNVIERFARGPSPLASPGALDGFVWTAEHQMGTRGFRAHRQLLFALAKGTWDFEGLCLGDVFQGMVTDRMQWKFAETTFLTEGEMNL
jgi:hypothetical protein